MSRPFNAETLQQDLRAVFHFSKSFLRRPLQSLQSEGLWDYQRSLVFLALASILSGLLAGLIQRSVGHAIVSVVTLPFLSAIAAVVIATLLYYVIHFVHQRQVDKALLFQVVAVSLFPFLIFRVVHSFVPPVTLLGLAATCALLIVGLTDRLQLPRRSMIKIISIFFGLYLVYWGVDQIKRSHLRHMAGQNISEDSLKLLDQEFGNGD
jgi:hypothetical protein